MTFESIKNCLTPLSSLQKALEVGSSFDPACLASTETFFQTSSNIAAARDYIRVYASNPTLASRSPCAAATKAYAKAELASGSTPAKAALLAFIDSAILSNDVGVDPVCSAAANAYIDSFVGGAGRDQKWDFQKGKNILISNIATLGLGTRSYSKEKDFNNFLTSI